MQTGQHVGQPLDQHQLTNMFVWFALDTNMLAKKEMKEKCWPTFLKKLRNVGQQIKLVNMEFEFECFFAIQMSKS